jgi:hypothetical protein
MAGSVYNLINTINGTVSLGGGFEVVTSDNTEINTDTVYGQIEAYRKCGVVQDAIELKASLHSTLRIAAVSESGRWLGGNQGSEAEKRVIRDDMKLINYYNEDQSALFFQHKLKTMLHIFGCAYIQKLKMVGFKDRYSYYIIPNDIITPVYSIKSKYDVNFKAVPDKYIITVPNGQIELFNDEVFVVEDRILDFGSYKSSLSRLVGLKESISSILSANQMFTQLIADGGARGIIGQGAKDAEMSIMLKDETAAIQKALKQYGKLRGQLKYIVTRGSSSYTPLTSSIVDMQLPENLLSKKVDIYRGFGIPTAFAVNEARFQVVPEARKEIFNASVTPEGKCIYEMILKMKNIPERSWRYISDDSHHDFYQESLKDSSIAFQQASGALVPLVENNLITRAQASDYLDPYLR